MLAIDTNVVVRLLVGDHPDQSARARELIERHQVLAPTTIILESELVLRGAYGLAKADVLAALRAFAGLPNVTLQEPERVAAALKWADGGMDFADALHLAAAADCEAFVTFELKMAKATEGLNTPPVREP
ncbi:MAG: type II toxin-antitoxin system VapC family toxin [Phenylobacterium sp.]|uniref:type II toxin-antitoxin system VapC family toxin n=1 Tax=Phenylobacterium sp. TaxID=1871053 RepID=UPI0025F2DF5B|nr:type II toxin-antitoxin system VapC family toxin [Phenylobacterium sp.]MCG9915964.1 type II toxin-antitoxin system VapC family toxin [Phenylobacterium sp.]